MITRFIQHIIRSNWWKYLAIVTLVITSFLSLGVPLAPNILTIDTNQLKVGTNDITVTGYNTRFDASENQAWIEYEDYALCAIHTYARSSDELLVRFDIPQVLPEKRLELFIHSGYGGIMRSPQRVWVSAAVVKDTAQVNTCYAPIESSVATPMLAFPNKNILNETIRNLNFHVPMWFSMIFLMLISFVCSIVYLRNSDQRYDMAARSAIHVGLLFACCGLATGSLWARFTWGAWWTTDPQLNGAAISTLIYLAYFLLRRSIEDPDKQARIAAVYAIFAFVMFYVFVKVIPGMADFSLHPDTTDNPSFKEYDVEDRLKLVLRLSAMGWIALSFWIFTLRYRFLRVAEKDH
ncbi:MAG: cytochrome c biogenesis protein CcsA [Flavobacteriales bacterium]|nr:cytochrome c biogenesis protein CcsA [Flavobacteriales bacterium]